MNIVPIRPGMRKCAQCKSWKPEKDYESDAGKKYVKPISRCIKCRLKIRNRYKRTQLKKNQGYTCIYCNRIRYMDRNVCFMHINAKEFEIEENIELVYEYSFHCIFCSFSEPVKLTEKRAKLIKMGITARCPKCKGMLELRPEDRVVGRIKRG